MIIGFDGKRAVQNNTGLGNYSRLLVEKMATIFPDNRYRVGSASVGLHSAVGGGIGIHAGRSFRGLAVFGVDENHT